jgi:hypothetical protein
MSSSESKYMAAVMAENMSPNTCMIKIENLCYLVIYLGYVQSLYIYGRMDGCMYVQMDGYNGEMQGLISVCIESCMQSVLCMHTWDVYVYAFNEDAQTLGAHETA